MGNQFEQHGLTPGHHLALPLPGRDNGDSREGDEAGDAGGPQGDGASSVRSSSPCGAPEDGASAQEGGLGFGRKVCLAPCKADPAVQCDSLLWWYIRSFEILSLAPPSQHHVMHIYCWTLSRAMDI